MPFYHFTYISALRMFTTPVGPSANGAGGLPFYHFANFARSKAYARGRLGGEIRAPRSRCWPRYLVCGAGECRILRSVAPARRAGTSDPGRDG